MEMRPFIRVGFLLSLALLLAMIACSDGRPDYAEANAQFLKRYPGVEILETRISMEEVIARSFVFKYRKAGSPEPKEIEIQFMEDESTGKWIPVPEPPIELP